ncbi:MAG: hypothetical protein ACK5L5_05650 [Bacteroidales bacterium]
MKKIISLVFFSMVLLSIDVNAQCGKNLFKDVTVNRCETDYTPIDLGTESGLGLSLNGGFWVRIVPGSLNTTPVTGEVGCVPIEKYAIVIEELQNSQLDETNIYNLGQSSLGTCEFIYVATQNQGCGINADDMVRVTLKINPDPKNISSDACPDEDVDLYSIIQPYYQGFPVNSSTVVDFAIVGNNTDEHLDPINGIYNTGGRNGQSVEIQFTVLRPGLSCNINSLVLNIADRDGLDPLDAKKQLNICKFGIGDPLDLYTISGIDSALYSPSGQWKQLSGEVMFASHRNDTPSGVIDTTGANFADTYWKSGEYVFQFSGYNTNPCDNIQETKTATLTLNVTDDLLPFVVDTIDKVECGNTQIIALDDYLPVTLPAAAGAWLDSVYYFDGKVLVGYKDINSALGADIKKDNLFYASLPEVRSGTYYFKYRVSSVNTKLCGLANTEFVVAIDLLLPSNLISQSLEICNQSLGQKLNLFSLLNEPVEEQDGVWSISGKELSASEAASFIPSDYNFRGNQTYVLDYSNDAKTCGTSVASLYITVKNTIVIGDEAVEIYFCYSNGADFINISNIAGFAGIKGHWTWTAQPSSNSIDSHNVVKSDGTPHTGAAVDGSVYFKGLDQYVLNNPSKSGQIDYIFTFKASNEESCLTGTDEVLVKVVIGDTMTP